MSVSSGFGIPSIGEGLLPTLKVKVYRALIDNSVYRNSNFIHSGKGCGLYALGENVANTNS
jgi:hypothetical protein